MISATWWTNSTIYIPEYSQYWYQHAVINLVTTKREFTLLECSTTLSSLITSFCIIFDICYMMNQHYYKYSRILPVLISAWRVEFNHYKREFTLLQYSTTLSSIIASFCIIFDICYMMNQQCYIYSRVLQVLFQHAAFNLITTKWEFTLLQYSTTLSSLITSFCIIFDICNILNYRSIYIPEYSQYWFQNAALNLITARREFTLLQYTTTLSSIIASLFIIFDICYMMNQHYYKYSRILPVLISPWRVEFNQYKREFTLLQYSTTLSSLITSFCIIFDFCHMMNQQYYIYSRILPVLISACRIEFNHYKREFTVLQYSTALSSIIISFCVIFDICDMMNLSFYIYSSILPVLISTCCNEFNHYKTWIYSITVFHNTLKHNRIILYHILFLLHDEPTLLYIPEYSQYWYQHAV